MKQIAFLITSLLILTTASAFAQEIDFGDDSGEVVDNICDDRRFEGAGMELQLGWKFVGQDASDCSAAYEAGTISLWNLAEGVARTDCAAVNFGDDSSEYADDGACDDPRFEGFGSAERPGEEHMGRDASDCQKLCDYNMLFVRETAPVHIPEPEVQDPIYGDNSSEYSRDGECDDRRFFGPGMADVLRWSSVGRDAEDCREAHENGRITLWDPVVAAAQTSCDAIDFGTNASEYANDGTCDDMRFEGRGAAASLTTGDEQRDANDCQKLCGYGMIFVRETE
ncbi:MAG: hypothetical protein V3V13_05325 [Paracoccaceae bacterium]